jgi:hypothetical protein
MKRIMNADRIPTIDDPVAGIWWLSDDLIESIVENGEQQLDEEGRPTTLYGIPIAWVPGTSLEEEYNGDSDNT